MRKTLLLFLLILSLNSSAQYKTVYSDRTTLYGPSSTGMGLRSFLPIKIDSIRIINQDTIYYNFRVFSYTGNEGMECKATSKGYAWTGKSIVMSQDQREIFINADNDSLTFKSYANIDDSWIFFQTAQNHFVATVKEKRVETFKVYLEEVTDSVLTISLSLRKNDDNSPLDHPFNGKEWKISKTYGFVQTYNLLNFPKDTNAILLAGVDKFNMGVKNLSEKEIYDFEVGDVFHIEEYSTLSESIVHNKIRQIILDKSFRDDSVIYKMEVLTNKTTGSFSNEKENFSVSLDTIDFTVAQFPVTNGVNQLPLIVNWQSYNIQDVRSIESQRIMIKSVVQHDFQDNGDDSCYNELLRMISLPGFDNEYWEGLGGPYYNNDGGVLQKDIRKLVFYKKGTTQVGEPLAFVLGLFPNKLGVSVGLSPNPATDRIKVSSEGIQNTYYRIHNNEGREVLFGNFSTTEETIDINNLRVGIYSIMILKEGGVVYTSRFVKN